MSWLLLFVELVSFALNCIHLQMKKSTRLANAEVVPLQSTLPHCTFCLLRVRHCVVLITCPARVAPIYYFQLGPAACHKPGTEPKDLTTFHLLTSLCIPRTNPPHTISRLTLFQSCRFYATRTLVPHFICIAERCSQKRCIQTTHLLIAFEILSL